MTDDQITALCARATVGRDASLLARIQLLATDAKTLALELPQALETIRRRRERQEPMQQAAARRALAAERIDPKTCHRWPRWVDVLDVYGEDPDPYRETNIGVWWFVCDPDGGPAVKEHHVRSLHPEISDAEWTGLMTVASRRAHVVFVGRST
jgi:hypothetical protein